jgi:Cobalamin biosynthesis protein CbiD
MAMNEDDDELQPVRRRGLRTGYTTGACATAAALAATRCLLSGEQVDAVTIRLPAGVDATFHISACQPAGETIRCSVIKDAGDDPDVTHGAEIVATVWKSPTPGIVLRGGNGVGTVTLPGLGLDVGGPAINPVPRRMILEAVTTEAESQSAESGLVVEISVPRGEELAKKTLKAGSESLAASRFWEPRGSFGRTQRHPGAPVLSRQSMSPRQMARGRSRSPLEDAASGSLSAS